MTHHAARCGSLEVLLTLAVACSPAAPPTGLSAARVFVTDTALSKSVMPSTLSSRFVLYDDGRFVLQYSPQGSAGYRGRYEQTNQTITFEWEGWSSAGPWGATGTLSADTLSVRYNVIMQLTDFEDAVYIRTQ